MKRKDTKKKAQKAQHELKIHAYLMAEKLHNEKENKENKDIPAKRIQVKFMQSPKIHSTTHHLIQPSRDSRH